MCDCLPVKGKCICKMFEGAVINTNAFYVIHFRLFLKLESEIIHLERENSISMIIMSNNYLKSTCESENAA